MKKTVKTKRLRRAKMALKLFQGRIPGQLVIQMTDRCNASCPQCGMRVTEQFTRSKLEITDIKKMIDAAAVRGISSLSFTGGETFLYFNDLLELLHYAGNAGISYIRTGTNGFMFMNSHLPDFEKRITQMAEALAKTKLRNLWISLDSSEAPLHETMRGLPGVIQGIEKALPIFHAHGIYPAANLGINRNTGGTRQLEQTPSEWQPDSFYFQYRQAFSKFYTFAIELGFTMVNACYPMSIDGEEASGLNAVYGASSVDQVVKFTQQERILLFQALMDTIPEFRSKIRIFSPRTSLFTLIRQYSGNLEASYPCRGGIDFFFIDARTGQTYPCGYRGQENLGRLWELKIDQLSPKAHCRQCDWECFRDPSELLGNVLDLCTHPATALGKLAKDEEYRRLWLEDIKYYRACDFFDGRKAPHFKKLAAWQR